MTLDKLQFLPEPRPALEWAVALLGCDPMVGLWGESLLCQARPPHTQTQAGRPHSFRLQLSLYRHRISLFKGKDYKSPL